MNWVNVQSFSFVSSENKFADFSGQMRYETKL